jgi:hypothetical protein
MMNGRDAFRQRTLLHKNHADSQRIARHFRRSWGML